MSLEKLFTGSATAKILDVLWEYQDIDLTLTDMNELNLRLAEKEIARQEMPALRKERVIA